MSNLKDLKKMRKAYERMLRANIQRVEGAFDAGNYEQVKHALVDCEANLGKIQWLSKLYMED